MNYDFVIRCTCYLGLYLAGFIRPALAQDTTIVAHPNTLVVMECTVAMTDTFTEVFWLEKRMFSSDMKIVRHFLCHTRDSITVITDVPVVLYDYWTVKELLKCEDDP